MMKIEFQSIEIANIYNFQIITKIITQYNIKHLLAT